MTMHFCDLCGAGSPTQLPQDPRIAVCSRCGFIYVPERRSPEQIAKSWEQVYADGLYDPNWPAVKARLFYVAEWIDQTIGLAGKSLIDIGAGKGQFLRFAAQKQARVFGIEPAATEYDYDIVKRSIEDGPLNEKWDVVTINWTLENTADPMAMLRFARDHVKPDGWVVVATGSRILVPFKKALSKYLNLNIAADLHCSRWSYNSLTGAGVISGMKTETVNPYRECDWLVAAFRPSDTVLETVPGLPYFHDAPQAVLDHFATWEKVAP